MHQLSRLSGLFVAVVGRGPGRATCRRAALRADLSAVLATPVRAGEIGWALLLRAMKRDPHLETPDTEQQRAGRTGGHKGPIAFLHLIRQCQLKDAPAAGPRQPFPQTSRHRNPREDAPTLRSRRCCIRRKTQRIVMRSSALVDPCSTHRAGHGAVIIKSCLQQHSDQIIPCPQQSCQTFTSPSAH